MLLKFKKKFHKYLSTYILPPKLRKERGQVQTKQILFIILHVSYAQKEEKWFHHLQTRNINQSRGIYILELGTFGFRPQFVMSSSGSQKPEKLTSIPSVY